MSGTTGSQLRENFTDLSYTILDNGIYGAPSSFVSSQAIWRPSPDYLTTGLFYYEDVDYAYIYFGSLGEYKIPADNTGNINNPAVLQHLQVGTGTIVETILDEDNMVSDSDIGLATQQSIKAYVDTAVLGGISIPDNEIAFGNATGTGLDSSPDLVWYSNNLYVSGGFTFTGDTNSYFSYTWDGELLLKSNNLNIFEIILTPTQESLRFNSNSNPMIYANQDGFGLTNYSTVKVNEIVDSITGSPVGIGSWSTDDQLATAAAIYDYVEGEIGTLPGDIYVTGASFNTTDGIITLTRSESQSDVTVDIDGRYEPEFTKGNLTSGTAQLTLTSGTGTGVLVDTSVELSIVTGVIANGSTDLVLSGDIHFALADKVNIYPTPDTGHVAIWTDGTTIEGNPNFTYDATDVTVTSGSIITDTSFKIDALQLLIIEATTHGVTDIIQISDGGSHDFIGMNSNQGVWIGSPIVGDLPGYGDLTIYGQTGSDVFLSITSEDGNDQYIDFHDYLNGYTYSIGQNVTTSNFEIDFGSGLDQSTLLSIDSSGTLTIAEAYSFPIADGSADYVLATDGSGTVSWQSLSAVGSVIGSGVAGQVTYWDTTDSITGDISFTWSGTLLDISGAIQLSVGTSVNEIVDSITGSPVGIGSWSTDDQLVTAAAIYDYVEPEFTKYDLTSATTNQLTLTNGTGAIMAADVELSIAIGEITNGSTHLVTSDTIYDYIAANTYWTRSSTILYPKTTGDDVSVPGTSRLYIYDTGNYINGSTTSINFYINSAILIFSDTDIHPNVNTYDLGSAGSTTTFNALYLTPTTDASLIPTGIHFYLYDKYTPIDSSIFAETSVGTDLYIKYQAYTEHMFYVYSHAAWTNIVNIGPENVYPKTNNSLSLGSSTNQWYNLYVDNIGYIDNLQLTAGATVNVIETVLTDDDTRLPTSGAVYAAISGFSSDNFYLDGVTVNTINDIDFTMTGIADITGIDFGHDLETHDNVTITSLADTHILKYNGTVWVNVADETGLNYYADSLGFLTGTGVLTIGRTSPLGDLTQDLDGRYAIISGTMASSYVGVWNGTQTLSGNSALIWTLGASNTLGISGGIRFDDTFTPTAYEPSISWNNALGISINTVATATVLFGIWDEGYSQPYVHIDPTPVFNLTIPLSFGGTAVSSISTSISTSDTTLPTAGAVYDAIQQTALGYVNYTGTPVNNQVAVFTDVNTIEGVSGLIWNGALLDINGAIQIGLGTFVSEIVDSVTGSPAGIGSWSTDNQLATAKAIWDTIEITLDTPSTPGTITLTEVGATIRIEFVGDDTNDSYEIWASQTSSSTGFNLINIVKNDDLVGTPIALTLYDNTYTRQSQIWYKVYARRYGVYSIAATANITPTNDVADVSGLITDEYYDNVVLHWVNPEDRRLDSVEVWVDAQAVELDLDITNATKCYDGKDENFQYKMLTADLTKFHEFWVITTTKT